MPTWLRSAVLAEQSTSRGHNEVKGLAKANSMIMPTACCCGKDE